MDNLSRLQQRLLQELSQEGHYIAYGHYGGYSSFVCREGGNITMHAHGSSIKSLLNRSFIHEAPEGLIISDAGRNALKSAIALAEKE